MASAILPPQSIQPQKKVLIVDDMPQVRQDLRQLLELTGLFEIVAEAGDGLQALHLTVDLAPDVVVLDLEMPIMDGLDVTCQIKTHNPSTRVVILSAYAGREEIEHSKAAGADAFVMKGDRYEVLVAAILGKNIFPGSNNSKKGK